MSSSVTSPTIGAGRPYQANEVGSVPSAAGLLSVTAKEYGLGPTRQTVFTLSSTSITQTRTSSAIGNGGLQIYDFPACGILLLGASMSMTYLTSAGAAISDANMIHSLGSVVASTANAALTSTEADWIPSTAAANGVGVGVATTALIAIQDGNSSAKDLYLNINTSSDITATRTLLATGWIVITWANLGYTSAT